MIQKEFRALGPTWLALAAALTATTVDYVHPSLRALGAPVYFIGAVALGAQAIGHEFSHRTLAMLLTQPVSRQRTLLVKLGVLASLLVALCGVAAVALPFLRVHQPYNAAVIFMPVLLGLFVAPWLTMTARSSLAGTVFPVALVGMTMVAGAWLGVRRYGYTREVDTFRVAFMWWTMGALCAVSAAMTWWTFMRLQITDGMGAGLEISTARTAARSSTATFTRRNPLWLLLMKELHLQQLALVMAAVYLAGYLVMVFAFDSRSNAVGDSLTALTIFYGGVLAMLIGALASAEERQLGTHEWQQLMPMAAWQQWTVKAGTAIALALALGIGLPLLLMSLLPPEQVAWTRRGSPFAKPITFILITIATTGSLYVSSVTRSGLWALMISLPVAFGVSIFFSWVGAPIERAVRAGGLLSPLQLWLPAPAGNAVFLAVLAALLLMVLRFGLANHRSSERSVSRISQQVAWMMAWTVAGLAAVLVLGAI